MIIINILKLLTWPRSLYKKQDDVGDQNRSKTDQGRALSTNKISLSTSKLSLLTGMFAVDELTKQIFFRELKLYSMLTGTFCCRYAWACHHIYSNQDLIFKYDLDFNLFLFSFI